ncbi:hypothetical protein [Bacillus solitudinis]|uniref:hypothetical protein n=1 Tax=Bacillus solitudinis TaxID=2014074 RepID=UPI000C234E0E|nr:hypothetical protein [Bacillus solitudinis]
MSLFQSMVLPIAVPFVACVIFAFIFSKIYKATDKLDKGFEVNYFKLTHRRKMVRTLTSAPIILIALIIIHYYSNWSLAVYVTFILFVLLALCIQLVYNYKMWKKDEGSKV